MYWLNYPDTSDHHSAAVHCPCNPSNMLLRLLLLSLLFVTLLIEGASAQSGWSGCINPNDLSSPNLITIGQPTTICLTIGPGGAWGGNQKSDGSFVGVTYLRYTWQVTADQYSRFHIPYSYDQLIANPGSTTVTDINLYNKNLTVFAASQQLLSFLRVYYDEKEGRVYPFLTMIVDAKKGVVQGISWDDSCIFCSKNKCLENMYNFDGVSSVELGIDQPSKGCYFTTEQCNVLVKEGKTDCDLTFYVVWTGSDVNNRPFTSAPNRFSAFPLSNLQQSFKNSL